MIDWSRVNELKSEVGEEDFGEVVDMFLGEVEEIIERLRSDAAHENLEADLHFLKSSALNLGFSDFANICSAGESDAAQGKPVDLAPVFDSYLGSRADFSLGPGGEDAA